jgi:N-acetyl-alpha-D-glucosaminyl L-malate synthase BshA
MLHTPISTQEGPVHRLDAEWAVEDIEAMAASIVKVTRAERLQLLHFHYAVPFCFILEEVARQLWPNPPRLVGTLHGTDVSVYGRNPDFGPRIARALGVLDSVTTVSSSHAALAAETFGLCPAPVVIRNFVDLSRWNGQSRIGDNRAASPTRPRIVHVSNFRPIKRSPAVARVFAAARQCVDADLWLVGDGEEMPEVKSIIDDARLGSDVRYFGVQNNVEGILSEADVMLITSSAESFCLAALEALASGVPVVAPRVGGLPELVEHGINGLLFDPDDDEAARACVVEILSHGERRAAMSRQALRRARLFSRDAAVAQYVDLYRALLNGRHLVEASTRTEVNG